MHPVDVAPQGIDLAVMGCKPERLRQVPGRESVGAIAGMDQGQGARQAPILQVNEKVLHLMGHEAPLVGACAAGRVRAGLVDEGRIGRDDRFD